MAEADTIESYLELLRMETPVIAGVLGWLGAGGTLVAYIMVANGRVSAESARYSVLNTVGGALGGRASAMCGAWAASSRTSCGRSLAPAPWSAFFGHDISAAVPVMHWLTPMLLASSRDRPRQYWSETERRL